MFENRKIIHIDMDCFYAAIEMRDNPTLKDKPIAVGGSADRRGVLCTANYIARQYGVRSAMATSMAYRQCKDLIVLPVNMEKYEEVSKRIQHIFTEYTDLVEPLALDEAYLDVTHSAHCNGSATLMAKDIRQKIWEAEQLTASAGVAPNKFLAKIASGWKKPNGLFVILPQEINVFVKDLPVTALFGVGKVTAEKLHKMQLTTCSDLQKLNYNELIHCFGKFGKYLYEQCRGLDTRPVENNRIRKSLSVETTFSKDLHSEEECLGELVKLYEELLVRLKEFSSEYPIKSQYIKIKFSDFRLKTAETATQEINKENFLLLFQQASKETKKSIRLLGLGVHFHTDKKGKVFFQQSLF
jgi:DNA polymerase-4